MQRYIGLSEKMSFQLLSELLATVTIHYVYVYHSFETFAWPDPFDQVVWLYITDNVHSVVPVWPYIR